MTDPTVALWEYLGKFGLQLDDDLIREGVRAVIQAVIEAEVTGNRRLLRIGAKPYERTTERAHSATATANGPTRRAWAR
jgi:hypothetical protein